MLSRLDFIAAASGSVVAAAATPPASPTHYDLSAFTAALRKPAHHRAVFGATALANGAPLSFMYAYLDAYENKIGEKPGSARTAAVLYHGYSLGFAYGDDAWNRYLIPALIQAKAPGAPKPGDGNPYLRPTLEDGRLSPISVEALVQRGVTLFVCENSMNGGAQIFAQQTQETADAVLQRLRAALVPGAIVVPSGVMALAAAQEAGFAYIHAS